MRTSSINVALPPKAIVNRQFVDNEVDSAITAQDEFIELIDTPATYTGEGGKAVVVKGTEDGLEFGAAGGGGFFTDGVGAYSAVGQGAPIPPGAYGTNALAQGGGCAAQADNTFSLGQYNLSFAANSFTHGYFCNADGTESFAAGNNCLALGDQSFALGMSTGAYSRASFAQGYRAIASGVSSFAQGYQAYANVDVTLAIGRAVNAGGSWSQVFGENVQADTNTSFAAGREIQTSGIGAVAHGYQVFMQGDWSFAAGQSIYTNGYRIFAHGEQVRAERDDQKVFGSNRPLQGASQSSHIIKWLQTTNNTPQTILTLDLEEDKTYSIVINIAARDTTTNGRSASFVLTQALAYRDPGGAAVLVNGPVALTKLDSTGTLAISANLSASGDDLILQVTGQTGETYEWTLDFAFVESQG